MKVSLISCEVRFISS